LPGHTNTAIQPLYGAVAVEGKVLILIILDGNTAIQPEIIFVFCGQLALKCFIVNCLCRENTQNAKGNLLI
jgi:hypothetical protein